MESIPQKVQEQKYFKTDLRVDLKWPEFEANERSDLIGSYIEPGLCVKLNKFYFG